MVVASAVARSRPRVPELVLERYLFGRPFFLDDFKVFHAMDLHTRYSAAVAMLDMSLATAATLFETGRSPSFGHPFKSKVTEPSPEMFFRETSRNTIFDFV